MALASSFASMPSPTQPGAAMQSSSSSSTSVISPPPRFSAFMLRQREKARFRVILARNILKMPGRLGGMVFHALKYVSLTVSSAS